MHLSRFGWVWSQFHLHRTRIFTGIEDLFCRDSGKFVFVTSMPVGKPRSKEWAPRGPRPLKNRRARTPDPLPRLPSAASFAESWKIRYRILLWFFSQNLMIKFYKARSLLYRSQVLQENIRWKALDEIYKIYMLLHRSDLNISENFLQIFSHFLAKFCKFIFFKFFSLIFAQILMKFLSEFRR